MGFLDDVLQCPGYSLRATSMHTQTSPYIYTLTQQVYLQTLQIFDILEKL